MAITVLCHALQYWAAEQQQRRVGTCSWTWLLQIIDFFYPSARRLEPTKQNSHLSLSFCFVPSHTSKQSEQTDRQKLFLSLIVSLLVVRLKSFCMWSCLLQYIYPTTKPNHTHGQIYPSSFNSSPQYCSTPSEQNTRINKDRSTNQKALVFIVIIITHKKHLF